MVTFHHGCCHHNTIKRREGEQRAFHGKQNGALLLFAISFRFRNVDVCQLPGSFQEFWLGH